MTTEDNDDVIPNDTYIPLIDADPKVIARRLGEKSWESRARFFSNIITGSVGNATKMGELYGEDVEGWRMEMALVLCGIHERVAEVLELWGVEDPPDIHAACIYALSMSFEHRIKANAFFGSKGPILHDALIQKAWPNLAIAHRISMSARPGLSELWRRREDCDCGNGAAS